MEYRGRMDETGRWEWVSIPPNNYAQKLVGADVVVKLTNIAQQIKQEALAKFKVDGNEAPQFDKTRGIACDLFVTGELQPGASIRGFMTGYVNDVWHEHRIAKQL